MNEWFERLCLQDNDQLVAGVDYRFGPSRCCGVFSELSNNQSGISQPGRKFEE